MRGVLAKATRRGAAGASGRDVAVGRAIRVERAGVVGVVERAAAVDTTLGFI